MANCLISTAETKDCEYSFAGLDKLYFANRADIDSYTVDVNGKITAITMIATKKFYKYEFENNTGSYNEELVVNAGNKFFRQTVNFTLSGMDQSRVTNMETLGLSNVVCFAITKTGVARVFGRNSGLEATAMQVQSGAVEGDVNGVVATLSGLSKELAPESDASIIDALIV